MAEPTYLAKKNAHALDSCISFDEGPHIYTINGDSDYLSVTTWNHAHFPKFNADKIIRKMMNSPKWKDSPYFGMKAEQIKKKWRDEGRAAASAGTKMHYDIECYYNDMPVEVEEDCIEWKYFEDFEKEIGSKMEPYRTEWMIWDKEHRLAGSIDMIFENPDGSLQIYDWKRCKEIKKDNRWDKAITRCVAHLPDSNFWHYSLQLNTYKWMIEKNYGKKVTNMYLVCLHPNNKNKSFLRYEVPVMNDELRDLMKLRLSNL